MSGDQEQSTSYGVWSSPISAEMVASGGIDFGHTDLDGNTIYWREARPAEDGPASSCVTTVKILET